MCLSACMHVQHMHTWCMKVSDPLELDLGMIMSSHMDKENGTQVFCKSSKCS